MSFLDVAMILIIKSRSTLKDSSPSLSLGKITFSFISTLLIGTATSTGLGASIIGFSSIGFSIGLTSSSIGRGLSSLEGVLNLMTLSSWVLANLRRVISKIGTIEVTVL